MIIVLTICKDTSQFQQVFIAYHSQTWVYSRILARLHSLSGVYRWIENFQFPQHIIISHSTHNVNQPSETCNWMTASRMLQICNRLQILGPWRVFKNFWHLSFIQLVGATNQVNDALTWCNRPVKRRNIKVNFQRYDVPLCSIVGLQICDLNDMQIPFGQFKKV